MLIPVSIILDIQNMSPEDIQSLTTDQIQNLSH